MTLSDWDLFTSTVAQQNSASKEVFVIAFGIEPLQGIIFFGLFKMCRAFTVE